jgi:hypothetical protein
MAKGKPLTLDQKATLEQMVIDGKTDKEIAVALNSSEITIARYRKKSGLKKIGRGKLVVEPDKVSRTNINAEARTFEEKEASWRAHFLNSKRYKRLVPNFSDEDMEFFIEQWIRYHIQMNDMEPSEEDTLENLIIINIRINENQKNFREAQAQQQRLKEMLGGNKQRELDLETEKDRWIFDMILATNKVSQEINREIKDLRDSFEKTLKILSATREQREAKNKIGLDTFLSLVRLFNDRDRRKEVGKYNERMKIATESQQHRLKHSHTFTDGTQDAILLDGSDYLHKEGIDETESSPNNGN